MAIPGYLLPHRSHRADFPQRVPQTGLTGLHPDMADPRRQQRMTAKELFVSLPRHPVSARATIQPLSPDPNNTPIELQKALRVRRAAAVVLVVASELGVEGLLLLVHRCMSVLLAPCGDGREAPAEPFTHRTCTVNFPLRLRAQMCVKPRKSKVPGFFLPCFFARSSA
jgi:hypothetical protein